MRRIGMMFVLAGMLVACKGKDGDNKSAEPPPSTAPTEPGDSGKSPAPAAEAPAKPIDVCSFATKEQVEGVFGALSADPKPQAPQGALLGGCEYSADGGTTIAFASARPAHEFEATVKASGPATELPGVGEKAFTTEKSGVFVQPAGASYFLHVFAGSAKGNGKALAVELAKVVAAGAK